MTHVARGKAAFTLVELLVVITIIVLLLSLLAPALDSAITQAPMAKCGANLRTIGAGCAAYAVNNKNRYPKRQNNYSWDALMIKNPGVPFDIRPLYQEFMGLDSLVDPMLE